MESHSDTEYQDEYQDYGQWDVDRVRLQFRTVDDLLSLLKNNDIQLYSQSSRIHSELRKELYSVTSHQPEQPSSSRVSLELTEDDNSYPGPPSSPPATNLTENIVNIFNSICSENCHLLIFTSIIVSVVFILTVFSIIIICKRKNNYAMKSRQKGKCQDVQSSYIKSSISLDDMPRSPVSVLHNSPFYSPVREAVLDSPSQAPQASTFSTFHPQVRTSPEGSSCGDTETDLEQSKGDDVDESSNNLSIKSIGITPDKSEKEDIYAKIVKSKQWRNNNCEANFDRIDSELTSTILDKSECLI